MRFGQVCVGLLKSGEELKNQAEVEKKKKQSLMFSKDIIPKPDIRLFTEHFLSRYSNINTMAYMCSFLVSKEIKFRILEEHGFFVNLLIFCTNGLWFIKISYG